MIFTSDTEVHFKRRTIRSHFHLARDRLWKRHWIWRNRSYDDGGTWGELQAGWGRFSYSLTIITDPK